MSARRSVEFDGPAADRLRRHDVVIDLRGPEPVVELPQDLPSSDDLDADVLEELLASAAAADRRPRSTRAFDLIVGGTLFVLSAPLVIVLAALVRISSKGPALYPSLRRRANDGVFSAWKLRTMVPAAEQAAILATDPALVAALERDFKALDDPRITKVGRLLRRTSLDELPQLWNVVRGEMSLVGPRPKTLDEAHRYGPALEQILSVRPGLTGHWQTSGRNDLPFEERIVLDLAYIAHRSLWTDLRICLRTAGQLLSPRRHGAY